MLSCPEQVIRQYEGLAHAIARRYFAAGHDHEDLAQEALIGLCKAHRDYDPTEGVPFGLFARGCIERQVITAVKTATRHKHAILSRAASLDAPTGEDGIPLSDVIPAPARTDPAAQVIALETFRRQRDVLARATRTERAAVAKVLNGEGYVDDKVTDNALQRVRDKLRSAA